MTRNPDKYTYRGLRSQMKTRTITEDQIVARLVARKREGQLQQLARMKYPPHYSAQSSDQGTNSHSSSSIGSGIPIQHLLDPSSTMLRNIKHNPHSTGQLAPDKGTNGLPEDRDSLKNSLRDQLRAGLRKYFPKSN